LHHNKRLFIPVILACGQFVVYLYEGNVYLGQIIISFNEENVYISAMVTSLKSQKWPEEPRILEYKWSDALGGIDPPKLVSKRGFYSMPEPSTFF
jgi:hypothetical protein